ncbi:MAG TPA: peptidase S8 [Microscillaceae bacterium]|nr:peptidase S8 [Microscillaceae bacterium]
MLKLKQVFLTLIAFAFLAACNNQQENDPTPDNEVSLNKGDKKVAGAYIITFNTDNNRIAFRSQDYDQRSRTMLDYTQKFVEKYGVSPDRITQTYNTAVEGFAANLSEKEVKALKADPRIATVEPDYEITLDYEVVSNAGAREFTPYGIARVGSASGVGRGKAWVIDTGIDLDHPDLNVDRANSRTFISGPSGGEDDNGHGTHCAGTIAAKRSNNAGLFGVAYGATVVGVKVFNSRGGGSASIAVRGIDYVTSRARSGDVANMSFGFPPTTAIDNAVRRLADRGVLVSIAAGNSRRNVSTTSPGRLNYRNVVSVSAMDVNDRFASFSNFGSGVDFCAPGVDVWSTWLRGQYNRISGTSMAAPHVAGLMLLRGSTSLRTNGRVIGDPDGNADPIAVR